MKRFRITTALLFLALSGNSFSSCSEKTPKSIKEIQKEMGAFRETTFEVGMAAMSTGVGLLTAAPHVGAALFVGGAITGLYGQGTDEDKSNFVKYNSQILQLVNEAENGDGVILRQLQAKILKNVTLDYLADKVIGLDNTEKICNVVNGQTVYVHESELLRIISDEL